MKAEYTARQARLRTCMEVREFRELTESVIDTWSMYRARYQFAYGKSFVRLVIFLTDVERCIERLPRVHQEVLMAVFFMEYASVTPRRSKRPQRFYNSQEAAALFLQISLRTMSRRYGEAMDALTLEFHRCKILDLPINKEME